MSDSHSDTRDSSVSGSKCNATHKQESARKEQASELATVASTAAEFGALLGSKWVCFRCLTWMKLAELVLWYLF